MNQTTVWQILWSYLRCRSLIPGIEQEIETNNKGFVSFAALEGFNCNDLSLMFLKTPIIGSCFSHNDLK
jgi:hypothetical protein